VSLSSDAGQSSPSNIAISSAGILSGVFVSIMDFSRPFYGNSSVVLKPGIIAIV
jgi:hypothetical protein